MLMLAALAGTSLLGGAAHAGGSPFKFERESYEPGEVAVARAPFGRGCCDRGWIEDGPYLASINGPVGSNGEPFPRFPVGELIVIEEPYEWQGRQLVRYVAVVEFVVPELPPGSYTLNHCNDGCTRELGDVIGGAFWIGPKPEVATTTTTTTTTTSTTTTSTTTTTAPPTTTTLPESDATTTASATMPVVAGGLVLAAGVSTAGVVNWRRRRP